VEKRFALFLVLSALILFGHLTLQSMLARRRVDQQGPAEARRLDREKPAAKEKEAPTAKSKPDEKAPAPTQPSPDDATIGPEQPGAPKSKSQTASRSAIPAQRATLGSMAPNSPYRLLVTLNNQGAAVERIELVQRTESGKLRFLELEQEGGYLGYLALTSNPDGIGCRVNVVGPGTPAATAKPKRAGDDPGLRTGDIILRVGRTEVRTADDVDRFLATTKPGQTIELAVLRAASEGKSAEIAFSVVLEQRPLSIVRPEANPDSPLLKRDPFSLLFTLESIDGTSVLRDAEEIAGLPSLRTANWEMVEVKDRGQGPAVEFRYLLTENDLKQAGANGSLRLVKRYRLAPTPKESLSDPTHRSYHLTLEVEIQNLGPQDTQVAYRLDGPNGLPLEGWWYSTKIHPEWFATAGARDVIWNAPAGGFGLIGASEIYSKAKEAEENGQAVNIPLFPDIQPLDFVGVDTQYFAVALIPETAASRAPDWKQALALAAGEVGVKEKGRIRTTNATFRLISPAQKIAAGKSLVQNFTLFAGPKQPKLLERYHLSRAIYYGWFGDIASFLAHVLHFFARIPLVNYGLAIILLTALVRSCMIPLSRKAAKNAQMMQELAPEMKRIAEKYKNDMQKRGEAQRELFAKHNYNPFGGCLLMFLQLPIFIGLYRALSVDIELRQAPLIEGLPWCSNLAGPDMLWNWKPYLFGFLADETGWLGPYFNVLPIITIILFIVQQKMFMPPATDEQTRMQQQMMKYMMIFMGVLFYKVPSGLCIYFIASSLWGLAERKMLPPVGKKTDQAAPVKAKKPSLAQRLVAKLSQNGDTARTRSKRRPQRRA
jgi:YidC/Oxa1 family membrane protein insertase